MDVALSLGAVLSAVWAPSRPSETTIRITKPIEARRSERRTWFEGEMRMSVTPAT